MTLNSVSGGRTSAYVMANYPADYNLFSLVRVEDKKCLFPDAKIRQVVEDRIQAPFIGTAEDDMIIYTILDLEQHLGQKIHWVTGMTYDEYIRKINGGSPPNVNWRGCTTHLKLIPMAQWWLCNIGVPVETRIGYRANEVERANTALLALNAEGLSEIKIPVAHKKSKSGWRNVNMTVAWQRPVFPLIEDNKYKSDVSNYWVGKPVRFADYNNCVGCYNRSPLFLAKMYDIHPNKMDWFAGKEEKGRWRKDVRYSDLKKWHIQQELEFSDFGSCDTGHCEIV